MKGRPSPEPGARNEQTRGRDEVRQAESEALGHRAGSVGAGPGLGREDDSGGRRGDEAEGPHSRAAGRAAQPYPSASISPAALYLPSPGGGYAAYLTRDPKPAWA